jgi:glycosyltransferase involved in cell wall biosynthesis
MSGSSPGAPAGRVRNILYLHTTSEVGGSDVSLLGLVERLDRRRFAPVVALPADGPLVPRLRDAGCRVLIVDRMIKLTTRRGWRHAARFLLNYPGAVGRLVRIVADEQVDLIHTNTIHNPYGIGAAIVSRRSHVWHVREIVWQSGVVRRLERLLARLSDRVIVTSEAVGDLFRNRSGRLAANVRRIPNGVDLGAFAIGGSGAAVRAALGTPAEAPLAGVVCRLDAWKGVDVFLRAAARVREALPAARFVVVGGAIEGQDAYAHELEALACALGLNDALRFTGWRYGPPDMPEVYAALDLLVLPSRQPEPFGLVLLEAMASGLPVVATDRGGPREICVDGETGLLVPPGDPDRLADAMRALLDDPARARAMGQAGRHRAEANYDLRNTVRAIEGQYEELLGA